ncbi:hypothetical protein ACU4GD_39455 [Cupriavidus basilensis]
MVNPAATPSHAAPTGHRCWPGGHILVRALLAHGAELASAFPAKATWRCSMASRAARPALRDLPAGRARQSLAEAYGKLTGQPGLAFSTRGPGATNTSIGVHSGVPGFHADDSLHRPGRQRFCRSRGLPGDRPPCSAEMAVGGADQAGRADSRVHRARLPDPLPRAGPARVVLAAAGGQLLTQQVAVTQLAHLPAHVMSWLAGRG